MAPMTDHALPGDAPTGLALVIRAVRCWREARDTGQPTQPCLARALESADAMMLAPVFDSLCALFEIAIARPMRCGEAPALSGDERLLLGIVDGSTPRRSCIDCPEGAASALDCAICSTRIMMALAVGPRGAGRH
ncbi:hypothetical protein NED98_01225 [Sphingomonas sp. MMSM20]|uniref:hypothetical protein n=1 Tax=Sphingomonas lycopersici TaxID=2951807 RepID=UPI0022391375|nr:hypothetical protein [Sphingomonas lycopersici]MCW6528854.1 hypothetical protein [Sphingomonas lycopersici]